MSNFYSMHCVTVFVDVLHSIAYNCVHCGEFLFKNHCIKCVCVTYLVQKLHNN